MTKKPTWIVVDIGCIECGEPTAIVGTFRDKARAESIAKTLDTHFGYIASTGGDHTYEVFAAPEIDALQPPYGDMLAQTGEDTPPA